MRLEDFSQQFGALGDAFLFHFKRPFLVEEGRLEYDDDDPAERHVFYLDGDEERVLVGRSSKLQVTIPNHNVSSRHLALWPPTRAGQRWEVEDLGSTNGTYLNGRQLETGERAPIRDEEVIGFGPIVGYLFLEPQTFLHYLRRRAQRQGQTAPPVVSLEQETSPGMPRVALPDVSRSDEAHTAQLQLVCEPFDPLPLELGQTVVIGRSAVHAQLVLPHHQVSRRHAEVERREDGVYVRDLHSANGTYVGETKLSSQFMQLLPGKALKIDDFVVQVLGFPEDSQRFGSTVTLPATRRKTFQGNLGKLSLETLLLSLEETQKTGVLEVFADEASGRISFRAGNPCQAWADEGRVGKDAVCYLLRAAKTGTYRIDPAPDQVGEREITEAFSELALETFLSE